MPMMSDKAWKLCQRNGGIWGECEEHSKSCWGSECYNNETVLGYWDWVASRIEQEEDDAENND